MMNVGILEVLDANGLKSDRIAGSSRGAIVAALYAQVVSVGVKRMILYLDQIGME